MAQASQRPPAVAGLFYPADPHSLHAQISGFLAGAIPTEVVHAPKALVVPHAGYIYSGAVAASAYASSISDGAAALVLMRESTAAQMGARPVARLEKGSGFGPGTVSALRC